MDNKPRKVPTEATPPAKGKLLPVATLYISEDGHQFWWDIKEVPKFTLCAAAIWLHCLVQGGVSGFGPIGATDTGVLWNEHRKTAVRNESPEVP